MKSYHYSVYDRFNANKLAWGWWHKGNWFCSVWVANKCSETYDFPEDVINEYPRDDIWYEWCTGLDIEDPAFPHAVEIDGWRPAKLG